MGNKLPKNPQKGKEYTIRTQSQNGPRDVTFKATGQKGFGKFKITKNEPAGKKK